MKRLQRPQLQVEALEGRLVPAGNVAAALSGQDLTLFGDNLANEIRLSQNAAGDVTVTGLNGTTVNGRTAVTFANPLLIKTEMYLGDGNDRVVVAGVPGVSISNDMNVELGAGNDVLRVLRGQVGANLQIKGDQGTDSVTATDLNVGNDLYVDTGLNRGTVSLSASTVGGSLGVVGDDDIDTVSLTGLTVGGDVLVETKKGNDRVTLSGVSARGLEINTDLGADVIRAFDVLTSEDFKVGAGGDNDTVTLERVSASKSIAVDAGDGGDTVTATLVAAAVDAAFIGGAGVDTLDNNGISAGSILDIKEFEIFP